MLSVTNTLLFIRYKYSFAVVEALIDSFGFGIGGEYNIGCKFAITLSKSPLELKTMQSNYCTLVDLFHGHAYKPTVSAVKPSNICERHGPRGS